MARSDDTRRPLPFQRGSRRYHDIGGHVPPGDDGRENSRDHERIWFEIRKRRSCCDCEDPGFKYCFQTFDWPQYICDGEFPGGDTMVGYWPGTALLDSSWYLPGSCGSDEIRPANLVVPVSHETGSWRNGPYSDFTVGGSGYQGNLQSAGFNWGNFFPAQNRTLEAWIKPTASDISNGRAFIQHGLPGNTLAHGGLDVYFRTDGALGFQHTEIEGGVMQESGAGWWEADQWHHFVLVRNAATNSIAFFINGRLAISRVLPSTGWTVATFPDVPDIILQYASWADIVYYTSALSPATIRKHYNSVYGVEGVANPLGSEGTPIEDPTTVITEPISVDFIDGGGEAHTGDIIISQGDFADYVSPEDSPFELEARKGVADGYAPLDSSSNVPWVHIKDSGTEARTHFLRGDRVLAQGQIVPMPEADGQILVGVGDVSTDYQAGVVALAPNYYWPMTDSASPWDDIRPSAEHFSTLAGSPTALADSGLFSGETAVDFDSADVVESSATAIASGVGEKVFTFGGWFNFDALPASTTRFLYRCESSGFALQADGKLVQFCDPRPDVVSNTTIEPGRWYFIVGVWNTSNFGGGSTNRAIYIDGALDVNVASAQDPTNGLENQFKVGNTGIAFKAGHIFDIWTVLSAAQIDALWDLRTRVWDAVDPSAVGLSLPDTFSYADGDVLTLDASLDPVWETPTGGGGVEASEGGVDVTAAARGRVNFIAGTNVTIDVADDAANDKIDVTIDSTGGGGSGSAGVSPVLSYIERTTDLSVTATSEATAQTVVTADSVTLDGSTEIQVEFYCPDVRSPGGASNRFTLVVLYAALNGGAAAPIGFFGMTYSTDAGQITQTVNSKRILTPAAGDWVYSARAYVNAGTGAVNGGSGGSGDDVPTFIRVSTTSVAGGSGRYVDSVVDSSTRTLTANTTWEDVTGTEIIFDAEADRVYVVTAEVVWRGASANWLRNLVRLKVDGAETTADLPQRRLNQLDSNANTTEYFHNTVTWVLQGLAAGSHTIELQSYDDGSSCDRSFIQTQVLVTELLDANVVVGGGGSSLLGYASDATVRTLTTNTTFEDISGVTVTATTSTGKVQIVEFETEWRGTDANWKHHKLKLQVDGAVTGVLVPERYIYKVSANANTTEYEVTSTKWIVEGLSPGSHTFKVQSSDAGGLVNREFQWTTLIVYEHDAP